MKTTNIDVFGNPQRRIVVNISNHKAALIDALFKYHEDVYAVPVPVFENYKEYLNFQISKCCAEHELYFGDYAYLAENHLEQLIDEDLYKRFSSLYSMYLNGLPDDFTSQFLATLMPSYQNLDKANELSAKIRKELADFEADLAEN